ncbi:MAG: hypothetical protein JXB38_22720 [Anaerolineales bacterium]|nr:hypothetical protein [Anaerolineales bacterium]
MNDQALQWECGLGYNLSNKLYPHAPGFSRLEIFINIKATGDHFDPYKVEIPVCGPDEEQDSILVTHPWIYETEKKSSPGIISLTDHKGKKIEFFTFGGTINICVQEECTAIQLNSPAPIFDISDVGAPPMSLPHEYSIEDWLVEEFQCKFAQMKAINLSKKHAFEDHMKCIPPLELYAASLLELHQQLLNLKSSLDDVQLHAKTFISTEIKALKENEMWPKNAERLRKLF